MQEVRLVGPEGEQVGIVRIEDALRLAQEADLDLVEVAPNSRPPVAKLMDYGKFKYEQTKKERDARKSQKSIFLREVRFRPKIGKHDIEFKTRTIKKLIDEGNKVKVSILFRGREITHPELGRELLEHVVAELEDKATIERTPIFEGKRMNIILAPAKQQAKSQAKTDKEAPDAEVKDS